MFRRGGGEDQKFFIIRLPPESLPVSGSLTWWCASTLGAALLCSSRAGSWFWAISQVGMWLDESSFSGDFIMLRCSDKSYLIQGLSKSYMCEHTSESTGITNSAIAVGSEVNNYWLRYVIYEQLQISCRPCYPEVRIFIFLSSEACQQVLANWGNVSKLEFRSSKELGFFNPTLRQNNI